MITGLAFYAWGEPKYVVVLIISCAIDYAAGLLMNRFDSRQKIRTLFLIASLTMNLGLLSVFKYGSFAVQSLNGFFGLSLTDPHLPLPVGISFFTFQSMSYTIDLYRRKIGVQKNPVSFCAYVTMFPQIVAGPIVRYSDVAEELDSKKVSLDGISEGIALFVKGLSKKVLLANSVGELWAVVKAYDYSKMSAAIAWVGIIAFAFQIYFDFSGYSDMAVGLGRMMGFHFPQNFDHPYESHSVSEFWRRWHITLGSWFRSYVYIPLGGNRRGMFRTLCNLMITWALTGLWHGADWNFVLWGLYFGLLICAEKLCLGDALKKLPGFLSAAYTLTAVLFGWVLFETDSLSECFAYVKAMLGLTGNAGDRNDLYLLGSYGIILAACLLLSTSAFDRMLTKLKSVRPNTIAVSVPFAELAALLLCTIYLIDSTYNPFLYFRF